VNQKLMEAETVVRRTFDNYDELLGNHRWQSQEARLELGLYLKYGYAVSRHGPKNERARVKK
jgi:hypothetical protein